MIVLKYFILYLLFEYKQVIVNIKSFKFHKHESN